MTITAREPRLSESEHWYERDGTPRYTVLGKNGKERSTTLRDARKLGLVPSVTTIIACAAKPALDQWKQKQVLMSALTLPRRQDESDDEWIARIMEDSKAQTRAASDAGTDIHASIQAFYEGRVTSKHEKHVTGCVAKIIEKFGSQPWVSERSFGHEIGFGGKTDLFAPGLVLDVKSREFTDPDTVTPYDENLMQLSAYRVGLGMPDARGANVIVSRNEPGLTVIHEWTQEDLRRGWEMFYHLLQYWQHKTQHR